MQRYRLILLALLLAVVPVSSAHAGVFISVGIAPPVLPIYAQPPCPEPDMIWTPGYWAYDYDMGQYYWVAGAWVPAPYEGALWTPPYWGYDNGFYLFHTGYWGPVVGYYGGVNYGFGYMGIGFAGGEWREHRFFYNTAIINVNRTYIHNTYVNNTIVRDRTIVNYNHIAYNGGPRGIQHMPTPEERNAMQVAHTAPTRFQDQHMQEARSNRQNFFNQNHGRPETVAVSRPLPAEHVQQPANFGNGRNGDARSGLAPNGGLSGSAQVGGNRGMQPFNRPQSNMQTTVRGNENAHIPAAPVNQQPQRGFANPQPVQRGFNNVQQPQRPSFENRPQPQPQSRPQAQPQPRFDSQARIQPIPSYRPAPQQQYRAEPQQNRAPQQQARPQAQQRAPESHAAPQQRNEGRPRR